MLEIPVRIFVLYALVLVLVTCLAHKHFIRKNGWLVNEATHQDECSEAGLTAGRHTPFHRDTSPWHSTPAAAATERAREILSRPLIPTEKGHPDLLFSSFRKRDLLAGRLNHTNFPAGQKITPPGPSSLKGNTRRGVYSKTDKPCPDPLKAFV